jgi:hypothetical protein
MYENLGHAAYEESKDFNLKVYNFLRGWRFRGQKCKRKRLKLI